MVMTKACGLTTVAVFLASLLGLAQGRQVAGHLSRQLG